MVRVRRLLTINVSTTAPESGLESIVRTHGVEEIIQKVEGL